MKKTLITLFLSSITLLSIGQIKIYGIDITKTGGSNDGWQWDNLVGTYVKNTSSSTPFDAVYKFPNKDFTFLTYTGEYQNMPERYESAYKYLKSQFGEEFSSNIYANQKVTIDTNDYSFLIKGSFVVVKEVETEPMKDTAKTLIPQLRLMGEETEKLRKIYAAGGYANEVDKKNYFDAKKNEEKFSSKINEISTRYRNRPAPKQYQEQTDFLNLGEMSERILIFSKELYSVWHIKDKSTGNLYDVTLNWTNKGLFINQKNWGKDEKKAKEERLKLMLQESMIKGLQDEKEEKRLSEEKGRMEMANKKIDEEIELNKVIEKKKDEYQKKMDDEKNKKNILEKGIYAEVTDIGKLQFNNENIKGIQITFVNDTKKKIIEFTGVINAELQGYIMDKHSSRITETVNLEPGQKISIVYSSNLYNVVKSSKMEKKELLLKIFKSSPQVFYCESVIFSDGEKIKR